MKFVKLNGKETSVNITPYLINWDKKVSKPQKAVKDFLRPYLCSFVNLEEFRIPGGLTRIDLMCLTRKWAFEISPKSSHSFNPFFHKSRVGGFLKMVKSSSEKEEWAELNGFKLITLEDEDIKNLSKELFLEKFEITL